MDNPANPIAANVPPWHVSDDKPALPGTSPGGSAEPPVSGPGPSVVPPIPGLEKPEPSELPPIPEPIAPPEISVPQTPEETSLPPLPPPPPLPFVIKPASPSLGGPASTTGVKPPKKGGGGKAVLASLIFFFIAIATGIGFYFFQKGGLPFKLGKKAIGGCCTPGVPLECPPARGYCSYDPEAAKAALCTYTLYVCKYTDQDHCRLKESLPDCGVGRDCKTSLWCNACQSPYSDRCWAPSPNDEALCCKPKTWATEHCAGISVPSTALCCCRVIHPGCDEDCRWYEDGPGLGRAQQNPGKIYMQHCDQSGNTFIVGAQEIPYDYDCLKNHCTDIQAKIIGKTKVEGDICSFCKNKVWYFPPVTPTPTPRTTPTPTPRTTPTPTPRTTPTPTPTATVTPPSPVCSSVEAYKKGTTGLVNIVPGDFVVITVTSTASVTDMAVRIRTSTSLGYQDHIRFSNMVGTWLEPGRKWQTEYTISVGLPGGVTNYTIDGFVKVGGAWK